MERTKIAMDAWHFKKTNLHFIGSDTGVENTGAEAPLMVHIHLLRELRDHVSIGTQGELWWTATRSMLADALAKRSIACLWVVRCALRIQVADF